MQFQFQDAIRSEYDESYNDNITLCSHDQDFHKRVVNVSPEAKDYSNQQHEKTQKLQAYKPKILTK